MHFPEFNNEQIKIVSKTLSNILKLIISQIRPEIRFYEDLSCNTQLSFQKILFITN